MSDNSQQQYLDQLNHIYATLDPHDVEQFYADYQLWHTQQRIAALQGQIDDVHRQIAENAERLEQVHPPAVALATLVRLQAKNVNDIDLLDRMLERGEEWLDFTMQRLDYCEQLDFIHDNYTEWCEHALEGAYDWIDSMRDAYADTKPQRVVILEVDQADTEDTEELLLRKLTSDEGETSSLGDTLKRPAVSLPPPMPATEETPSEPEQTGQADKHEYVEFEHVAKVSLPVEQVNVNEHEYVEFAPTSGNSQETRRPQEPETVIPPIETNAEADLSPVPAEQAADEHEYIEFAPVADVEAEARQPQALEMAFPSVEADVEADSSFVSTEQANDQEHIEFAPVAEVSLPVETAAESDSSPVPVEDLVLIEEVSLLEYPEPAPTSEVANAEADSSLLPIEHATHVEETSATAHVQQEEPASPVRATNVTYNWLGVPVKHKEYPAPAPEVKPQRRPGFWRRLFSIFRL